jgi:hypothetical protein
MTRAALKDLVKRQDMILEELRQLKVKLKTLGSWRRFEELARKGRKFARAKGITPADVID